MAAERNITIYQGDTYIHEVKLRSNATTPINIAGRTYSGQIRKSKRSDSVIASFSANITDAANGVVQFSLSSNITTNIQGGVYYFDFQEVNNTVVTTLIGGKATIQGEVTRAG